MSGLRWQSLLADFKFPLNTSNAGQWLGVVLVPLCWMQ